MKHEKEVRMIRVYICAFCHEAGGTMVKAGGLYFHSNCPKKARLPDKKKEVSNEAK
jgi:hypothetical protein